MSTPFNSVPLELDEVGLSLGSRDRDFDGNVDHTMIMSRSVTVLYIYIYILKQYKTDGTCKSFVFL